MISSIGQWALYISFIASLLAIFFYYLASNTYSKKTEQIAHIFFIIKGTFILITSGVLLYLLLTNQFQYFYVFNYTSLDLQNVYLFAAFYSGQEGSFLLWILMSFFVGLGLIKWTSGVYRAPVLFFITITQFFLISMLLGLDIGDIRIGASPFRTLQSEMPNAPIFMRNPDFVPSDGSGLNDLLRSPWIIIHPPVLFIGFAMMTVPFAFALAALWKKHYQDWIHPALPWALGASLSLLTAIFLGGYWAYETLSFGGYWAWDPVENASLVPWIVGVAGIHTMLIQRKSKTAVKSSILFAILAYLLIIYETFLTRSGILGDSSVHSFVNLGLYNQLLFFMLFLILTGVGMVAWRYKDIPTNSRESPFLSREFIILTGATTLFLISLVIILGTSSPIIGRLFVDNPTPPDISFYNNWSMPLAIVISILTVIGQSVWRNKITSFIILIRTIAIPLTLAIVLTLAAHLFADLRSPGLLIYLFAALFALIGNAAIMVGILNRKPIMAGGSMTHVGLAVLLIGFLGSAYDRVLLDEYTADYNQAVERGEIFDEFGFPIMQKMEIIELRLNERTLVDNRYLITLTDALISERNRPGEQEYTLRFEDITTHREPFILTPTVYPMIASSTPRNINWSVDPAVKTGLLRDIYVYIAGSSIVEAENIQRQLAPYDTSRTDSNRKIRLKKNRSALVDHYKVTFIDFVFPEKEDLSQSITFLVQSSLEFVDQQTGDTLFYYPSFAFKRDTDKTVSLSTEIPIRGDGRFVQFTNANLSTGEIELTFTGIQSIEETPWVLLTVEKKPLISAVWLGTFLLMFGFSVAILRRWSEYKKREK